MIKKYRYREHGHVKQGWLDSHFHFSFAEYYNPQRMRYGVLRVVNDDYIEAGHGFDLHPHRDMEILSYIIEGSLTHGDSMGHQKTITAGQFQYMSAGSGIEHSEHNTGTQRTRLLQIWIFPDKKGVTPRYGDLQTDFTQQRNQWHHVVSPVVGQTPITLHQDVHMSIGYIDAGQSLHYPLATDRQVYLIQISGEAQVNNEVVEFGDSLEIDSEAISYQALTNSHVFIIEMPKSE